MYKNIFLITLILLMILISCRDIKNNETNPTQAIEEQTEEPEQTQVIEETIEELEEYNQSYYMQLYTPIINALVNLEQSGFAEFDEDFLRDSLYGVDLEWSTPPETVADYLIKFQQFVIDNFDELPTIVYTLYEINEAQFLFIGLQLDENIELVDIYLVESWIWDSDDVIMRGVRNVFNRIGGLSREIKMTDDGIFIETWENSREEVEEYFFIVGPGIGVGWLEYIVTVPPRQRYRISYTGLEDDELITEEEYIDIIRTFGGSGVNVDTDTHDIQPRYVIFDWLPINNFFDL